MKKILVLMLASLFLVGCGASMPARTGYDRVTGTWKASGAKGRRQKSAPAQVARTDAAPVPVSDVTDSAAPMGTKIRGQASFYGKEFNGNATSSGEPYDPDALTCAHRTMPFGTRLRVTYLKKGLSTTVKVNDRGPHKDGRILDLSRAAADDLGLTADGVGDVEAEVVP